MGQRDRWHMVEQRCHHPCHPGLMSESLTLLKCKIVLLACVLGGDVRLSRTPTRSSESVLGDVYQTLAEPMVLELVPVGGS